MRARGTVTALSLAAALALGACSTSTSSGAPPGSPTAGTEGSGATVEVPVAVGGPTGTDGEPPADGGSTAVGESGVARDETVVEVEEASSIEQVVVIGDSITVGAQPELGEGLQRLGLDPVVVEAQERKRIAADAGGNPSGVELAAELAAGAPGGSTPPDDPAERLWVVALGTNDLGASDDVEIVRDLVERLLDEIPDGAPLVWVDTYIEDRATDTGLMNDAIALALAERGDAVVARWSEVAPGPGVLSGDGVHPSDDGSLEFAALVVDTVSDVLGR